MKRRFTVMIIPQRGRGVRQALFSVWHLVFTIAVIAGFVALAVYCFAYGGYMRGSMHRESERWQAQSEQTKGLLAESESAREGLENTNADLSRQLKEKQSQLEALEEQADQAMSLLSDLETREAEIITQMGLGGVGGKGIALEEAPDNTAEDAFTYVISSAKDSLNRFTDYELELSRAEQAGLPDGWPVEEQYMVTCGYGIRTNPITHVGYEFHHGIDISARTGDNILAAGSGTVTFSGYDSIYGNMLAIDHGNGYITQYGHCSSLLVIEGDQVEKGEVIALAGNTGRSTGPHLDFRITEDGVCINPLDVLKK